MEYMVQEILSSIYDFLHGRKALIGIAVIADNLPNGISGITAVTYSTEENPPLPWLTKLALLKLSYDGNSETSAEIESALELRKAYKGVSLLILEYMIDRPVFVCYSFTHGESIKS